jgi:thiol-disulfide isomerase/thioredoxin
MQQVIGHGALLSYYRAIDVDDKIDVHASRILAIAPSLDSAGRAARGTVLTLAYTSLAAVYGDRAQAPQAITLLTRGLQDLADITSARQLLISARDRYALVGTKGASISATYWLNGPADGVSYTPTSHVTLLQFSAHWCGPCLKSYPAIARLQNTYAARGLKTVFVTDLYGFFQDRQHLTPAQEIEADREYFLTEHKLPIQLAISTHGANLNPNATAYKVSSIPYIAVLDKTGTIRMIVVGWDPASEARLATMVDSLL